MPVGGADWYKEQPTNRNFLNPIGFILKLEKFEGTDFFCQSANLPDINMPTTQVASQFRNLPIIPGGGVEFGDLSGGGANGIASAGDSHGGLGGF